MSVAVTHVVDPCWICSLVIVLLFYIFLFKKEEEEERSSRSYHALYDPVAELGFQHLYIHVSEQSPS